MTGMPCAVMEWIEWSACPRVRDLAPGTVRLGDLVTIRSCGENRLARVTKVGRTHLWTEYTTETAVDAARKHGRAATVTRKSVAFDDDFLRYVGRS